MEFDVRRFPTKLHHLVIDVDDVGCTRTVHIFIWRQELDYKGFSTEMPLGFRQRFGNLSSALLQEYAL